MPLITKKVAIVIPCFNEELTVEKVVRDFRRELPDARVIVFDNNSSDATAARALGAGAEVYNSPRKGKGAVIRHAFRTLEADIYILVDGDDTYPAEAVHQLLKKLEDGADIATGDRLSAGHYSKENKRPLHNFGNRLICRSINLLFDKKLNDVLTGYRAMSRRFVKSCPILIDGFEVETEITIHAIERLFEIVEVPVAYRDRPPGSISKLNTVSDGMTIMRSILWIFKDAKPLLFFSILAGIQLLPALIALANPAFQINSSPFLLAIGLTGVVTASVTFSTGLALDTVVKLHRERFEMNILKMGKTD